MEQVTLGSRFFNNLFGAIAGGSILGRQSAGIDFIPLDGKGGTVNISGRGQEAVWLGLRLPIQQKYAYEFCYPVASVCDKLAEMDTTGTMEIRRIQGKGKENLATSPWAENMRRLFDQPNPAQSWQQFRGQQVVYKKVFGWCLVLPIVPAGFENKPEYATALVNIPPWLCTPIKADGASIFSTTQKDYIKEYQVTVYDKTFVLTPDQVFVLEDSFMQDDTRGLLLPKSRLCGLDFAVSNICAAMEADNVILRKKGPMGVFSPTGKDGTGSAVPMTVTEREEAQQDLDQYGITWAQFQFLISRNPLQWQSVGFDVKQLGTKDTIIQGEHAICHRYGFPYILYEQSDATFANGSNAAKSVYQDNIIPNNAKDIQKYAKFFKAVENNCKIICDYNHLSILQEDALNTQRAALMQSQSLQVQYLNQIITKNQWLVAQGYEAISDGDVYYAGPAKTTIDPQPGVVDPNLVVDDEDKSLETV